MNSWNQTFNLLKGHDCPGCVVCEEGPPPKEKKKKKVEKGITSWFASDEPIYKSGWDQAFDLFKGEGGEGRREEALKIAKERGFGNVTVTVMLDEKRAKKELINPRRVQLAGGKSQWVGYSGSEPLEVVKKEGVVKEKPVVRKRKKRSKRTVKLNPIRGMEIRQTGTGGGGSGTYQMVSPTMTEYIKQQNIDLKKEAQKKADALAKKKADALAKKKAPTTRVRPSSGGGGRRKTSVSYYGGVPTEVGGAKLTAKKRAEARNF